MTTKSKMRVVHGICKFGYDDITAHFSEKIQETPRMQTLKVCVDKIESWTIETDLTDKDWEVIEKNCRLFALTYSRLHPEDDDAKEFIQLVMRTTRGRMLKNYIRGS